MNLFKTSRQTDEDGNGSHDNVETVEQIRHMEQLRTILFGAQMHDIDDRLRTLEERLRREARESREELRKRLDALETLTKERIDSLDMRDHEEEAARDEADKALESRITAVDEKIMSEIGKLREQLGRQSEELGAQIEQKHNVTKQDVQSETARLRAAMLGRDAVAEMFNEVALRLKSPHGFQGPVRVKKNEVKHS